MGKKRGVSLHKHLDKYFAEKFEKERQRKIKLKENSKVSRTRAKRKYNEKSYSSVHVHLEKDLVERFRKVCKENNVSQAQVVKFAIEKFLSAADFHE